MVGSQSNRMGIRLKEVSQDGSQEVGNGLVDLWMEFREYWLARINVVFGSGSGIIHLPPNAELLC